LLSLPNIISTQLSNLSRKSESSNKSEESIETTTTTTSSTSSSSIKSTNIDLKTELENDLNISQNGKKKYN